MKTTPMPTSRITEPNISNLLRRRVGMRATLLLLAPADAGETQLELRGGGAARLAQDRRERVEVLGPPGNDLLDDGLPHVVALDRGAAVQHGVDERRPEDVPAVLR